MKEILIVEDEMDVQLMLEKRLTAEGYSVVTAYNGNDALALVRSQQPDIILLDRVLGDMLGEEIAAKLRAETQTKDIPVIFISALFSKQEETERGHLFCGSPMFSKPYDVEELLMVIEDLIKEKNKTLAK